MRTIIDKLAETIESIELPRGYKMPFVYEDENIQNIQFDIIEPPLVACVPIQSASVSDEHGNYHERITVALWFADKMCSITPDYNARENERIIDACKRRAFKWAASLQGNKDLRLISVNGSERAYLESDALLTGYMLNVTIEDKEGIGICG